MNNNHVKLGAKLIGYTTKQQELALMGYEDAMSDDNSFDQSKLSESDRSAYNYGIWLFETENQQ